MSQYEKRGYLLENFRLFHLNTETQTKVDFHYHEFCKLLLLVSGRGGYVVDGQRYLLQPGDVVLVDSRSVHRPELESGNPYERIIIYISPDFLQKMSTADCDLLGIFQMDTGHVLRLKETERKKIFAMTAALEKELSGSDYGREIVSNAYLLRLMVEIGRQRRRTDVHNPHPVIPENPRVLEWMAYIDKHLTEDLDMDTLAERFFISKYHLLRKFDAQVGTTVHRYILQKRLLIAKQLLAGGVAPSEVCQYCGFGDYANFYRAFKAEYQMTPRQYVQSLRENL